MNELEPEILSLYIILKMIIIHFILATAWLFVEIVGERLVLSEDEMTALGSINYCENNSMEPWYFGYYSHLMINLMPLLRKSNLTSAWIGPRPRWYVSQGVEYVLIGEGTVSFKRFYETNDTKVTKKIVCLKMDSVLPDSPTEKENVEPFSSVKQVMTGEKIEELTPLDGTLKANAKRKNPCCGIL